MRFKYIRKNILSLILVLMLFPIASIFSACQSNDGYNLNKLQNNYWEIADVNNNVIVDNQKLTFGYPDHSGITSIISSNYPSLSKYNEVFNNLTDFMSSYIDECSSNKSTKNVKLKNQIKKDLDLFAIAVRDVNEAFDMFAEFIYINTSTPRASECVERYENLIALYGNVYQTAGNLTNDLTSLYYNYILKDGNPDVLKIGSSSFESVVVTKIESRIKFQISNLTQCFVEMFVGGDLAHKVANNEVSFDLTKNDYKSSIDSLKKSIKSIDGAIEKAEINKQRFYELSIQAQNFQSTLSNDKNKFVKAYNEIEYVLIKSELNKTAYQELCVNIIEANYYLVMEYNSILVEMVNIITN